MIIIVVVSLILTFSTVKSDVTVRNAAVSVNKHAVLECTTVTERGVLFWSLDGRSAKGYIGPSNIILTPLNIDNKFVIQLVEIHNLANERILKSTATTIDPVIDLLGQRSLHCYDREPVIANESTAFIIDDTKPPIAVKYYVINSTCINIYWSHPDNVAIVTGYYINHTSNGTSHIIPLTPSTSTSATIPVTPYTYNIFTVIATNGLINRSSSQTYVDIYGPEVMKFVYYINDDDINNTTNNTGHVTLLVSWEYTPNRPPVVNQTLSLDGTHNVNVPIGERSWLFTKVNDSNDHSLSLTATNVIDVTRKVVYYNIPNTKIIPETQITSAKITFIIVTALFAVALLFACLISIGVIIALCIACSPKKKTKKSISKIQSKKGQFTQYM
jgi:hypothetical protein